MKKSSIISMLGALTPSILSFVTTDLIRRRRDKIAYRSSYEPCIDIQTRDHGGLTITWSHVDMTMSDSEPYRLVVAFAFRAPNDVASIRGMDIARERCFGEQMEDRWARVELAVDRDTFEDGLPAREALRAYQLMLRHNRIAKQQRTGKKRVKAPMCDHVPWWNPRSQTLFFNALENLERQENPPLPVEDEAIVPAEHEAEIPPADDGEE